MDSCVFCGTIVTAEDITDLNLYISQTLAADMGLHPSLKNCESDLFDGMVIGLDWPENRSRWETTEAMMVIYVGW